MRRILTACGWSLFWLAAWSWAAGDPSCGQEPAGKGPAKPPAKPGARTSEVSKTSEVSALKPVSGIVVDPAGNPVPGCKVWMVLVRWEERTTEAIDRTTTDAQGRFAFRAAKPESSRERPGWVAYLARDPKGRVGWPRRPRGQFEEQEEKELRGQLCEVQEYRGRLVDTSGQPIAKAQVRPFYVTRVEFGKGVGTNEMGVLPPDLVKETGGETGPDGTFVLHGVPARGSISATITAGGFGSVYASWTLNRAVTMGLFRVGSVSGSVVCAEEPGAVAGVKLQLLPEIRRLERQDADSSVYFSKGILPEKNGSFSIAEVPAGKYSITLARDEKQVFYADPSAVFEVKPGQAVSGISLALKRGILVRGKVVDANSGAGVKDLDLYLYRPSERDSRRAWGRTARTDADGGFEVYATPGRVVVSVNRVPEGYLPPSDRTRPTEAEVTQATTLPVIRLERAGVLEGIVVDETGKPVAGAEVRPFTGGLDRQFNDPKTKGRSDAAGKFTLRQISAKGPIQFRARTDVAVTDGPVTLQPGKDPIRLVVSSKKAFGVRGSLSDEGGRPLSGATVRLQTMWSFASGGVGFSLATAKSDAQGRFEFPGLWPGDEYHIVVEAEGYDKFESPRVRGEPGKTHEFSKIVLPGVGGVVEGMVVDSAGRPMADVRVFNTGDAPETVSTRSDPSGRFRLEGLRSGPVYVFAEKTDCRFTGLRTTSGATGVVVKLLRNDEPLPPSAERPQPPSYEEQKKVARRMLEKLWATGDSQYAGSLISYMARIDRQQAQKWSAEIGGKYDAVLRRTSIEQVADSDLDEALGLLRQDAGALYTIEKLAARYAVSDPANAMRCAEEMAVRARALDQPRRAGYLARTGRLVTRLGNKEAGRKLIDEAAEMAAKLGTGESQLSTRGEIAVAMASHDAKRALDLLEPLKGSNQRGHYLMYVAAAACTDNLDKALEIAGSMEEWNAATTRLWIALRLAPTKPTEAMKVLDAMQGEYSIDRKAEACGWVAAATCARDKALACSLIDRGLATLLQPSERFPMRSGRERKAAFLAMQARQIGYPDMESVVYRVLASRPTTKEEYSPARVAESLAAMAAILALADPLAAKEVLRGIESRSEGIGSGYSGIGREVWLKAWALADPKHAEELFDHELAKLKGTAKPDRERSGLIGMAGVLATPPAERFRDIAMNLGFSYPREED